MKRALVTGHAGFIGRHFVRALADARWSVTGADLADPLCPRDARDFFRADSTRYDLVVHCAAIVGGRMTIDGAPLAVAIDLSIDAEMFNWAARTKPGRVVYFSSSAAYPVDLQSREYHRPLREEDLSLDYVKRADQTYGLAKITGEQLARVAEAEGVRVHVFRPFSGYGEDQALDYPFPSFIDRARQRDDPFAIWGDGTQVRDFIHVDDIIGAVLAAIDQDVPGPVNLGWGQPVSFNQLADMVCREAGYSPTVKHHRAMPTGVHYRVADPTKMLSFYTPRITLAEGIRRALRAS